MQKRLTEIALWFEERLQVRRLFEATAGHKVPASTNSWFYVLGSGTLLCFVIQLITGICLAFVYVPSTDQAWTTLQYLNHQQVLGWFLRAVHNWGSTFIVGIMTLHMVQTFLFGAFKFPRELTWISGCVLLLCTLGMAFTGQVLRFDQDAYWGLGIGASIVGRVPVIGAQEPSPPPNDTMNPAVNFRGDRRKNHTHASTTAARLVYMARADGESLCAGLSSLPAGAARRCDPRQKSDAVLPHVRICAGGGE
jgi:quinol-cytochrome oxidoreductase complex cytochrome b subunit